MNALAHASTRARLCASILAWVSPLVLIGASPTSSARAQLSELTESEQASEAAMFEGRRESWTLGRHNFVAPLSTDSVPFEFALPLAQLDSRTKLGLGIVEGERSEGAQLGTTHYALVTQVYDVSLRLLGRLEVALALEGAAATGLDGDSIVAGGLGAAVEPTLSVGYQLVRLDRVAILARLGARMGVGYRVNIQPLLYQVQAMPLSLLDRFDPNLVGSPMTEGAVSLGLGTAVALSKCCSLQLSARGERIATRIKPWLTQQGTQAEGARELGYQGWQWTAAAAMGLYAGRLLVQPQLGFSYRGDALTSPRQDRGPDTTTTSWVPAVELMFLASKVLQMGGGLGVEIGSTDLGDVYRNTYSTTSVTPFVQLVARYIWGQSWPGT